MSAFGGKADMALHCEMSAYDPKRTTLRFLRASNGTTGRQTGLQVGSEFHMNPLLIVRLIIVVIALAMLAPVLACFCA